MRGKTASPLHLKLSNNEMMEVVSFLDKISKYNDFENTTQGMIRSNLAMVSIGLLCNAYESISDDDETLFRENRALMESISYIHEKYYEKITIEDLAHIAHTSRSSYIMKFKEICKMPPASYITKVRIEAAASMLTNTNLTISEIADRTGFPCHSVFQWKIDSESGGKRSVQEEPELSAQPVWTQHAHGCLL